MTNNGSGSTLSQRIHECIALASACQPGPERDQYFAELSGLQDVEAGRSMNYVRFGSKAEQAAYERGYSDGRTLLRITKGGAL